MSVRPATDDPRKNRAHDGSVRTDTDQLADRLQELFGTNLVADVASATLSACTGGAGATA